MADEAGNAFASVYHKIQRLARGQVILIMQLADLIASQSQLGRLGGDKAVCVVPVEANASISYFVNLKIFLYVELSAILRA